MRSLNDFENIIVKKGLKFDSYYFYKKNKKKTFFSIF